MTDAESALLKVVLDLVPSGSDHLARAADGPVQDAIKAVLSERAKPEQRERFFFLYRKQIMAQREFCAFIDTIPRPVMLDWYEKAEEEMFPK